MGVKTIVPLAPNVAEDRSAECPCEVCSLDAVTHVANVLTNAGARPKVVFFIGSNIEPLAVEKADFLRHPCAAPRVFAINELLEATERSGVVVHTIDPTGLEPPREFRADRLANGRALGGTQDIARNSNTLLVMADLTGGRAVLNSNAPGERIDELFRESDAYYVVGFTPGDPRADRRTRTIEVQVNRRDVEVRTRGSYPERMARRRGPDHAARPVRRSGPTRILRERG